MILYTGIIFCGMLVISLTVSFTENAPFFQVFGITALSVIAVVLVDGLTAALARSLPRRFANANSKIFGVSTREKRFYEKIKIRKWKDKIPELGHLTGFRKNKMEENVDLAYVRRFLLENCYGEIGHFFSCIFGFFILALFFLSPLWTAVSIPVAAVNAALNVLPIFALRYNAYKLKILEKNLLKKQNREK